MRTGYVKALGCLLGLVAAGTARAQASGSEDYESVEVVNIAVFAGVGDYEDDHHMDLTHGPVESAKLREVYLKRGYQTIRALPTNGVLTKAAIIEAVRAAKAQVEGKVIGDFTFYFTGHGAFKPSTQEAVILPGDASANCESNVFTANELEALVTELGAARHTIILDSCFSGAMSRHVSLSSSPSEGELVTLSSKPKVTGVQVIDGMVAIPLTTDGFLGRTGMPNRGNRNLVYICAAGPNEPAMAVMNKNNPDRSYSYFSRELRGVLAADAGETGEVVQLGSVNDVIQEVAKGLTAQIGNVFKPVTNGLASVVRQFFPNAFKVPAKTKNRAFWQDLIDAVTGSKGEPTGSDLEVDRIIREIFLNFAQGAGSEGTGKLLKSVLARELEKVSPSTAELVKEMPSGKLNELFRRFLPQLGPVLPKDDLKATEVRVATRGLLAQLLTLGQTDPATLSIQVIKMGSGGQEQAGVNVLGIRDSFVVEVTCSSKDGWLVLLNTDKNGDIAVQWPAYALFDRDGVAKDAADLVGINADRFRVPPGGKVRVVQKGFTGPGVERYEAIFFPKQVKLMDTLIGLLRLAKKDEANVTLTGIPNREPSLTRAGISIQALEAGG